VSIRDDPNDLGEAAEPWGIGIGPDGQVAVADTFGWRVRVFDSDLEFTGIEFGEPPTNSGDRANSSCLARVTSHSMRRPTCGSATPATLGSRCTPAMASSSAR
jgi:hypothetical protein